MSVDLLDKPPFDPKELVIRHAKSEAKGSR
jgi:hypothetical protein